MKRVHTLLSFLALAGLLLAACGGGAAGGGETSQFVTSSGFVCPPPDPKLEVTSKQLNLFVWTEYIPSEWKECFTLVYGVQVNHDEYSSNEEMYAKLSAGGSNYDLVQPTDYIVELMVKQGLIQKLDKSRLQAVFANMDPNYMGLEFDPNNDYTLPYQVGTDALIYNADTVQNPPKHAGRPVRIPNMPGAWFSWMICAL